MIQSDIDVCIYNSDSFEDLLKKLQDKGYEIKHGKYIAVKHPKAQRFVRLKTLGAEYIPTGITERIANRDKFQNSVQAKSKNANEIERNYYTAINQTIVAVRQFKFVPRKSNTKKIYTFQNDYHINKLSEQLLLMNELNISSAERIYAELEAAKAAVDEKNAKVQQLTNEAAQLKHDIDHIKKYYNEIINGSSVKGDGMYQANIAVAKELIEKYNISSQEDISLLEQRIRLTPTYISSLKRDISDGHTKTKRLSELCDTYEKIMNRSYIDDLVAAEKEREREEDKLTESLKPKI